MNVMGVLRLYVQVTGESTRKRTYEQLGISKTAMKLKFKELFAEAVSSGDIWEEDGLWFEKSEMKIPLQLE